MKELKSMKDMLMCCVQGQMTHLDSVDTKELGEAIDMIKDLSEAIYYCTITEAMEGKEKEKGKEEHYHYYTRDMDKPNGRMYYDAPSGNTGGSRNYNELEYTMMRDDREGRSPMVRKMYMEAKEMHQPKEAKMRELEKYLQELSSDITEMIAGATPEEKQMLSTKLNGLVSKITAAQ